MALDISSGSLNTLRWLYQEAGLCNARFGARQPAFPSTGRCQCRPCVELGGDSTTPRIRAQPWRNCCGRYGNVVPSSLAVYRKTALTPAHEAIHWVCLRFPSWFQRPFLSAVATPVWR